MRIRFTRRALAKVDRIFQYIARDNPAVAARVVSRIDELTGQLVEIPEMGEAAGMRGIHKLVARPFPYLIFYEIAADEIIIHHVRHGARRPWRGER